MEFDVKHNLFCSEYLGMKCGDVKPNSQNKKFSQGELSNFVKATSDKGFKFLSLRFDASNVDLLSAAVSCDFIFTECLITFSMNLDVVEDLPNSHFDDDLASLNDIDVISQISRGSFEFDRFHIDPLIDDCCADELKAAWSENCVRGRSDKVFVVRDKNRKVIGFNACKIGFDSASIDLIAVEKKSQKTGVASRLVQMCVQEYGRKKNRLFVGTQANNKASINFYVKHGFLINSIQYTFHRHAHF